MSFGTIIPRISVSIQCKQNVQQKRRRYLNSSVCFVTKFGLSSGMKYPIFGNVIPVTLFVTFWNRSCSQVTKACFSTYCQNRYI